MLLANLEIEPGVLQSTTDAIQPLRQAFKVRNMKSHMAAQNLRFACRQVKLLIAEDSAAQRELYARYLHKWDLPLELEFSEDGFQAMISIGKQTPNILIADLMMPSMNGFEMIKSIHAIKELKSIHIIVVTALDAEHEDVCQLVSGGIPVLHKPFLYDDLKEMIEHQLSHFTS